ncbi:GtrA family protein [Pseudomonas sp. COR58]|uniref:GtrA family protein n=1 Tax=Pseudomonas ekonensis TaxID=2842353 RepID=A0ABS6P8T6_9PSED|nr:GtrA family protein [Pseudomonas ekonensis]MBV4456871.1 GtrA family protein [Pseudomonas ekonensis]
MGMFWKGILTQVAIGVVATLIHWQVFFVLLSAVQLSQAQGNVAAYGVAASFSFYMNALYTFELNTSLTAYLLFIAAMGGVSYGVGLVADERHLPGLVTVLAFTLLNLLLGYGFFRFVLFRRSEG